MTVPIRTSGATTARSSAVRIRNTTTSTIGGVTFESQAAASRTSNSTALAPPTSVPGAALCAASRIGSIRSKASVEYGGGFSTACTSTPGSPSGPRPLPRLTPRPPRPAPQLHAVHSLYGAPPRLHGAGVRHDDVGRRARTGGEAPREQVLALD